MEPKKKLGLIVNPIAGIGGRVGLKGSDGPEILRKARELGAVSASPQRTVEALRRIAAIKDSIELITYPHEMGEDEARESGFEPTVIGQITKGRTTSADTRNAAREMWARGVDLILFSGGDGTARDIYEAVPSPPTKSMRSTPSSSISLAALMVSCRVVFPGSMDPITVASNPASPASSSPISPG